MILTNLDTNVRWLEFNYTAKPNEAEANKIIDYLSYFHHSWSNTHSLHLLMGSFQSFICIFEVSSNEGYQAL